MGPDKLLFFFSLTIFYSSCILNCCTASKIVLMPMLGNSHYYIFRRIAEELGDRGHQTILLLGSDQDYKPSEKYETETFRSLDPQFSASNSLRDDVNKNADQPFFQPSITTFLNTQVLQCDSLFNETNKEVLERLQGADIVIGDGLFMCASILSDYLAVPRVEFWPSHVNLVATLQRVPCPLSYVPMFKSGSADTMTFLERVKNVGLYGFTVILHHLMFSPPFNAIKTKYNIKPERGILEAKADSELVIFMNDFALDIPQPLNPGMVLVGPLLPRPPAPLSEDLERFLSSSGEAGVVLVSFGAMMFTPPPEITDKLAKALGRLKQKVLWKIDAKAASSLSSNIRAVNWFPQNDLLGHPQTRAFVSHVGLNSLQEAAYHGVPVVGIPLWGDQPDNAIRMTRSGMGLWVDVHAVTSEKLYETVANVIENSSFKANATRVSRLLKDRRRTPLQETADWIEYVLRHGGAKHLRPEVFNITWYQYYLLDVALFLVAILAVVIKVVQTVCRCVCGMCKAKKKNKTD